MTTRAYRPGPEQPVQPPSLAELIALTERLHALEGRHTTRVDGRVVQAACPPGCTHCFCGTGEALAAHAARMRGRIAALAAGTSARSAADAGAARREQLIRWHRDDHASEGRGRGDAVEDQ